MAALPLSPDADLSEGHSLSVENIGDLLLDCHTFLTEMLSRRQPEAVRREGRRLLSRLDALVDWETLH